MEELFCKQDEMRGHTNEVELLTLDPKSFDNIQDLFTKFKDLLVDYLGWFSLMSTLEESLIANSGSTKVWVIEPSLFDL
jgi:hypothetical protein